MVHMLATPGSFTPGTAPVRIPTRFIPRATAG
jgi:hypothetical protein